MKLLKQINKVDSAKDKIEKSVKKYLYRDVSYENERNIVIKKILNGEAFFNSTDEACLALQLEKEGIRYLANCKIGSHSVDFLLPNMKRIIEVDGELYHTDENKEFVRERSIMSCVGEEYEIVRFPASYVPRYIIKNLRETIEFIVDKRKFDGRFRDTRYDGEYLRQYLSLQHHIRRSVH